MTPLRTRETGPDVRARLLATDPARQLTDPAAVGAGEAGGAPPRGGDGGRLARIRLLLDDRLAQDAGRSPLPAPSRHQAEAMTLVTGTSTWQRRAVSGAVVAAMAASAFTAVRLSASDLFDRSSRVHVQTAGISADGQLSCGTGGYADPLDPASAPLRLLPTSLPAGWSFTGVLARSATSDSACLTPSLFAIDEDASGTVRATASVVGPVHVDLAAASLGAARTTTVDGHRGFVFDLTGRSPAFARWVWTDDDGRTWEADISGDDLTAARSVVDTISTDGDRVAMASAPASGFDVVHQRAGDPYAGRDSYLDWLVDLSDGTRSRSVEIQHATTAIGSTGRNARSWIDQYATVGSRSTTIAGHRALIGPSTVAGPDDAAPGATTTPVIVELDEDTVLWTEAIGDLAAIEELVASLAEANPSDPRLRSGGDGR